MARSIGGPSLLPTVSPGFPGSRRGKMRPADPSYSRLAIIVGTVLILGVLYITLSPSKSAGSTPKRSVLATDADGLPSKLPGLATNEPLVSDLKEPEQPAHAETLVLYVFAASDPEYLENFRFFLREGVHENDGCQYLIAIQEGPGLLPVDGLPKLPPNARYVHHENKCYDLGTVGWLLRTHVHKPSKYRYVMWLNSSVRGPYLPTYVRRHMHWTEALTDRLNDKVKMVGATINCGGAHGAPAVPHVQSYLAAVDQTGFQILLKESSVFDCYEHFSDTVIHGELGASAAIFMAGYSIDCLMLRYQGVNWRSRAALDCNAGMNPIQNNFNDGINVDPFEVMFVKVKASMRDANWTHTRQALKFAEWRSHERGITTADLQANDWLTHELPRLEAEAARQGPGCFDWEFYIVSNQADLAFFREEPNPATAAWEHYLSAGMKEGRPARFSC